MKLKMGLAFVGGFLACAGLLVLIIATRSPTKAVPAPERDVYYPGTENLQPDEMRIVALGTGVAAGVVEAVGIEQPAVLLIPAILQRFRGQVSSKTRPKNTRKTRYQPFL